MNKNSSFKPLLVGMASGIVVKKCLPFKHCLESACTYTVYRAAIRIHEIVESNVLSDEKKKNVN